MKENDAFFDRLSEVSEPEQVLINGERKAATPIEQSNKRDQQSGSTPLAPAAVRDSLARGECPVADHGRMDLQSRRDGGVWWCFHCRRHYKMNDWQSV
jgi:hypothetical protein